MARVKLSEYKAKSILLGGSYHGVQLRSGEKWQIPEGKWVAKVDQGTKKRMKQGLVAIDKPVTELEAKMHEWEKKAFSQFLLEPLVPHEASEEQYLSLERVREGVRVLHAAGGGIDIEEHPEKVGQYLIRNQDDATEIAQKTGIPRDFLRVLYEHFNNDFFAFLEINPLVVQGGVAHLLDAAVLVDSAGAFFTNTWKEEDIVRGKTKHPAEGRIEALAATTPASLKLSVINPDGAIFFLLSGGGGSIVIADEAQLEGVGELIGNYGEYSGGPTREETYLYAKEVIGLMLGSKAKKKALVIAGGVANFTDVKKTFDGIIDALRERAGALRGADAKVFVRRGGPNEAAGLALMKAFLEKEQLLGAMYGSDTIITAAIGDAIEFIKS
jgi:ATP-citrate lyase beta-subunit